MIRDLQKWWDFLTYDGFKSHVNVTGGINFFSDERIRVGKKDAGKSALNQAYDKFQSKQDKAQTRQIMRLARRKILFHINQCQIIMIISTVIQNIPAKVWTDYFVTVNLHPRHCMTFHDWIKNISPDVKTGDTEHFRNHEGSYYDAMSSVWKNIPVPVQIEVICIIDCFFEETPPGKSPWTKKMFCLSFIFFS